MGDPLIVNVALTGCVHPAGTPNLPVTPEEVGEDARRCADAGATMFHVHARDRRGNPTWRGGVYHWYVRAVREAVPGAVVVASCSGRHFRSLSERAASLGARPDMASLTVGSFNFRDGASVNEPTMMWALLDRMNEKGIRPEVEIFDLGHVYELRRLMEAGHISTPVYANLFLGACLPGEITMLGLLVNTLPEGVAWAGAGLGRHQWNANRWAATLGGHARVGLEDALWIDKGERATNAGQVERIVALGRSIGREPATVEETRRILGL